MIKRFFYLFKIYLSPLAVISFVSFLVRKKSFKKVLLLKFNFLGGAGGTERAILQFILSHPTYYFFLIPTGGCKNGPYFPSKKERNYSLSSIFMYFVKFDAYINFGYSGDDFLCSQIRVKKRAFVGAGKSLVEEDLSKYNLVLAESNLQNEKLPKNMPSVKRLKYNINVTFPKKRRKIEGLPEKFFLSVFNPYGAVKGGDLMFEIADKLSIPLVHCYSDASIDIKKYSHKNIISFENLPQEELYWLYENAFAYICFSRAEGFGWALADALYHQLPVISREVGILLGHNNKQGVYTYKSKDDLEQLLFLSSYSRSSRLDFEFSNSPLLPIFKY